MNDKKKLIVLMGRTCSGKDTLLNSLLEDEKLKDVLRPAITYTTRPKRLCETDGVEHHFVDKEYYENLKSNDPESIVATYDIGSNIYFTTEDVLDKANIIILDIDSYDKICQSGEYEVLGFYINPSDMARYERGMKRAKSDDEQIAFLKRMVMEFIHEPSIDNYDDWGCGDYYSVDPSFSHSRDFIIKKVYEFMESEIYNNERIKYIVDVIHAIGLTNSEILDAYDAITDEDINSIVPDEVAQEVGLLELCDELLDNSGSELLHKYTKDQIDVMFKWYKLLIRKSNYTIITDDAEMIEITELIDDYLN